MLGQISVGALDISDHISKWYRTFSLQKHAIKWKVFCSYNQWFHHSWDETFASYLRGLGGWILWSYSWLVNLPPPNIPFSQRETMVNNPFYSVHPQNFNSKLGPLKSNCWKMIQMSQIGALRLLSGATCHEQVSGRASGKLLQQGNSDWNLGVLSHLLMSNWWMLHVCCEAVF